MDQNLEQIRARADMATPGPWHVHLTAETYVDRPSRYPIYSEVRSIVDVTEGDTYVAQTKRGNEQARADAEFIAHAREDVDWLLTVVERLRDALVEDRARLNRALGVYDTMTDGEPKPAPQHLADALAELIAERKL